MSEAEITPEDRGLDPSEMGEEEKGDNKITAGEKEIKLEDGESIKFPTVEVERMHLFIGKTESGLVEVPEAYETTVGDGVYLTSQQEAAEGYALRRSKGGVSSVPTVYKVEIQNLSLLDLTTQEAQEKFTSYWKEQLLKLREELVHKEWSAKEAAVDQAILNINTNSIRGLRDITFSFGNLVRDTLKREGFDGLTIEEGGEGRGRAGRPSLLRYPV